MTSIYKRFRRDRRCVLFAGDCLDLLAKIPDGSVDLTFTSPPYCMGKEYEATKNVEDFVELHRIVLPEVIRATKDGGSICWQVGYHVNDGCITPLDYLVHHILCQIPSLVLRNRIVWTFGFGLNSRNRLSGRHEVILWYTKGEDYFFNVDAVRIPQKYPGKRHYKGEKRGEPSCNPLGKNPGDVWDIPNVKANHIEKTDHPCQFPIGLVQRAIKAFCPARGLVLDPYSGSGTTGAAAMLEGRRFVGAEIRKKYYSLSFTRIRESQHKRLRYRPHDLPVMPPNPRSKVAQAIVREDQHVSEAKKEAKAQAFS